MSLMESVEIHARKVAARGARTAVAGFFTLVALGFFTVAAWLALSETLKDPIWLSVIFGGVYAVVGLILWLANRQPASQPTPQINVTDVISAFVGGTRLGRQIRR